jgi:hypothetical protein
MAEKTSVTVSEAVRDRLNALRGEKMAEYHRQVTTDEIIRDLLAIRDRAMETDPA